MEFKIKDILTQEEQDYINGVIGFRLVSDSSYAVYSKLNNAYRIVVQYQNLNPEYNFKNIDLIIYKNELIKLTYNVFKNEDKKEVVFYSVEIPPKLQNENEKIIEIIKESQLRMSVGQGGNLLDKTIVYPNDIPFILSNDIRIPLKRK